MNNFSVVRTCRDSGERLAEVACAPHGSTPDCLVRVCPEQTFQTFIGLGGAFTESAAVSLSGLSPALQDEVLRAYFDPKVGAGYTLGRLHMNSCDFSLGNWACCETPGDTDLEHFSIDRYRQAILPMIKKAAALAGQPLTLFVSPWSPPAWMKDTGKMNWGGHLLPEYRETWALYYVRFIQALEAEGLPIWGLTVQNEPAATQSWDSCLYSAEEEKNFVRDHLGPALHRNGLERIKVIIWDHNRGDLLERALVAYRDEEAAKYIWGAGFHWYERPCFDNVRLLHELRPDKHLIFTEGCQEGGPHVGSWAVAERYGESIIHDLNNGAEAWTDWNLVLDQTGGPNHVGNLCSAPILADLENDRIIYNPSYYYLAQFARYIRPGARRILCAATDDRVACTAFENVGGSMAVVLMNRSPEDRTVRLCLGEQEQFVVSRANSLATALWLV